MRENEWDLCKDLLRFLHSVDEDGQELATVVRQLEIYGESEFDVLVKGTTADTSPYDPVVAQPTALDPTPSTPSAAEPVTQSPLARTPLAVSPTTTPTASRTRPPLPTSNFSSSSTSGLSSLLFGSSPSGSAGVFYRPMGPQQPLPPSNSPTPSPARPRVGEGSTRWV